MPLTAQAATRKDRQAPTAVELQHRHFAFIASVIASIPDNCERYNTAIRFADACAKTNKRFDRDRFLFACLPL